MQELIAWAGSATKASSLCEKRTELTKLVFQESDSDACSASEL